MCINKQSGASFQWWFKKRLKLAALSDLLCVESCRRFERFSFEDDPDSGDVRFIKIPAIINRWISSNLFLDWTVALKSCDSVYVVQHYAGTFPQIRVHMYECVYVWFCTTFTARMKPCSPPSRASLVARLIQTNMLGAKMHCSMKNR